MSVINGINGQSILNSVLYHICLIFGCLKELKLGKMLMDIGLQLAKFPYQFFASLTPVSERYGLLNVSIRIFRLEPSEY